MTCIIGSDHGGLLLSKELIKFMETDFKSSISNIIEFLPQDGISVDYPDYAKLVCEKLVESSNAFGILICGSGIGMSIAANRFKNIRAALCINEYMAKYARAHNDANVLCIGERVIGIGMAKEILRAFINGTFDGGRHIRRIEKL